MLRLCFLTSLFILPLMVPGQAFCAQVVVAWDPETSPVAGYKVYYGTVSRNYTNSADAGANTTFTIQGLTAPAYFLAATAYDSTLTESDFSAELSIYLMSASAGTGGSISPAGNFFKAQGDGQTFSILPNANYQILDVQVDGKSVGAVSTYTISGVSGPHTISATFQATTASYNLTAMSGTGGSISPSGTVAVNSGAVQTFSIIPGQGYQIADVQVDGVSVGATGSYTFSEVGADHTISASFALNTYTIIPNVQANGSISPASSVSVNYGSNQTFTIIPNNNYKVSDVQVDGVSVGAVTSYTFSNVAAGHTITASFALNTFTITPAAQANGSISPASAVSVNYGSNQTFTITPNNNYKISDVQVDGVSVGAVTSYTFSRVAAGHTITASFALNTFTITPTAQANGSISPASAVSVNNGSSQTFTIIPNTNYKVSDVQVDGVSVGAVGSYTFSNVSANHTITVSFSALAQPPVAEAGPDQTVARGAAVTLNGNNSVGRASPIASYLWTQTGGPAVSISHANAAAASFKAPSVVAGGRALTFMLTVTDQSGLKSTDTCIVNLTYINQPPVAGVGPDQTVSPWTIVTLDGTKSTDPEGSALTYYWEQIDGPMVAISQSNVAQPTFVAPEFAAGGASLTFRLTVADYYGLIARKTCMVNVTTLSTGPSAVVGSNQTVGGGRVATLDGSGSTDSGSVLSSFLWNQTGGSPVTLSDPTAFMPTFTAPRSGADPNPMTFMLTVKDQDGLISRATQTVKVNYVMPDLVGKWTSFSYAGGAISGSLQVSNIGNANMGTGKYTSVAFYLSSDGISLSSLISNQSVGSLNAGQSQLMQFRYSGLNLTGKYIVAVIDPGSAVSESNETNNVARALIQ